MSLIRKAIKSSFSLQTIKPNHGLPYLLRQSPQRFSTETETETETPAPDDDSAIDPFLQTPNRGLIYGKINGVTKHTLRSDIIHLLEGCKLTPDDVKVNYSRNFMPVGMMVQFPSRNAFDNAFKVIAKKGRLYKLDRVMYLQICAKFPQFMLLLFYFLYRSYRFGFEYQVDRSEWDAVMPYSGKTVLLQGIPPNALVDDVERFLSGCEYDASSIQMFVRPGNPELVRMATVRFPSQTQAMHAFLTKNRGFCLNNQILVRVLP